MNIYPAIDLLSGKCVRLYQGSYKQVTFYDYHPVELAAHYAKQGASFLHVVDLDGAKQGKSMHLDLVLEIQKTTRLSVQLGGGIRTREQVDALLSNGISRVVLGSIAISDPETVMSWIKEFGESRFVLALDTRIDENNEPKVALHGWETTSEKNLWQMLDIYQECIRHVLCTDISRDGTLQGPNVALYQTCVAKYPNIHFQASGGVSSLEDLRSLAQIPVTSVIVGKAFYQNAFSFSDAINEVMQC